MRRIFSRAMRNLLFGAQTTTTSRETRATYEKKKKKKKKKAAVGRTYRAPVRVERREFSPFLFEKKMMDSLNTRHFLSVVFPAMSAI